MNINNKNIDKFIILVRNFCNWIENPPLDGKEEIIAAQNLLADLYCLALKLPDIESDNEVENELKGKGEMELVSKRFNGFQLERYRELSNPLKVLSEDIHERFILGDFIDIYSNLKENLFLYERGFEKEAVWEWRFSFYNHWGYHVLSALNALHFFFNENYGAIDKDKWVR